MGPLHLRARDAPALAAWYARALGLSPNARDDGLIELSSDETLLVLHPAPDAAPRVPRESGLFHVALVFPTRAALATTLRHLLETREALDGASDHLVSEAIYLHDPEGNGIEIYVDRPRDEWRRTSTGELEMASLPLDIKALLTHAKPWTGAASGTRVGHVHLQVGDVSAAEAFYRDVVGFDLVMRYGPDATFLSAGGYHHHIGANAWGTRGGPEANPEAVGLARFVILVPDAAAVAEAHARLKAAGRLVSNGDATTLARDPAGNVIEITTKP